MGLFDRFKKSPEEKAQQIIDELRDVCAKYTSENRDQTTHYTEILRNKLARLGKPALEVALKEMESKNGNNIFLVNLLIILGTIGGSDARAFRYLNFYAKSENKDIREIAGAALNDFAHALKKDDKNTVMQTTVDSYPVKGKVKPKMIYFGIPLQTYFDNKTGFDIMKDIFNNGRAKEFMVDNFKIKKTVHKFNELVSGVAIDLVGEPYVHAGNPHGEPYTSFLEVNVKDISPAIITKVENWDGLGTRYVEASFYQARVIFSPVDYLENKKLYNTGAKREIGLSGLALHIEEAQIRKIPMDDKTYENLKRQGFKGPKEITQGKEASLFSMDSLGDKNQPPYYSVFNGEILDKKISGNGVAFKVRVLGMKEDWTVEVWIYAKKSMLPKDFKKGDFIRGVCWLQGVIK